MRLARPRCAGHAPDARVRRVVLARTAPFAVVEQAAAAIRSQCPDARLLVLTQAGTEARIREMLRPDEIATVPPGFFRLYRIDRQAWRALRTFDADCAVLVDARTPGASFRHWRWLFRLLGLPTCWFDAARSAFRRPYTFRDNLRNAHGAGTWIYAACGLLWGLVTLVPLLLRVRSRRRPWSAETELPRRILYVAHEARLNGSGVSLLTVLEGLDRTRFIPIVCAPDPGPLTQKCAQLGIPVHIVPTSQLLRQHFSLRALRDDLAKFAYAYPRLVRLLMDEEIDVVHTNSLVVPDAAIAAWICGIPRVWHFRECLYGSCWPRVQLSVLHRLATRIIAVSDSCLRTIRRHGPHSAVTRIYNAISDTVAPAQPGDATRVRAAEGLPTNAFVVVVLGTLMEAKGQIVAVRAIDQVRRHVPGAALLLVGPEGPPGDVASIRREVASRELGGLVRFLGHRADVLPLITAADVVVVPSTWEEPFGRVAIEAMTLAKPVVASRSGGLQEIVIHGETGLLVAPGDPTALAEALVSLAMAPDLAAGMGRQGRERVRCHFSIEPCVAAIQACYAQVLDRTRHAPHAHVPVHGAHEP